MTSNVTASTMTSPSNPVRSSPREQGPYVLRPWVDSVPLSADGTRDDIKINCVEYYDGNLYVGTSASELLHFVRIPPDPADPSAKPVFIPASRLTPVYSEHAHSRPGVQQILLLPRVGKACILCNRTVTFYSLPELTPSGTREVNNCNWIGGVDLNESHLDSSGGQGSNSVVILLSTNRRIQVVKIEDGVRAIKNIDFAGSILSVRRDTIACVADSRSYALIDVDQQLKIPLMNISSVDEDDDDNNNNNNDDHNLSPPTSGGKTRSASSGQSARPQVENTQSHGRSRSAGGSAVRSSTPSREPQAGGGSDVPPLPSLSPPSQPSTPQPPGDAASSPPSVDKPLPPAPARRQHAPLHLKPHIASPTSEEFLLVMGTSPVEPGVGMFINLDGDPTRPTIIFSRYPKEIVVDGGDAANMISTSPATPSSRQEQAADGYVLASMAKEEEEEGGGEEAGATPRYGIEIQRWDAGSEAHPTLDWLEADDAATDHYGLRSLTSSQEMVFDEIVQQLSMVKYDPFPNPLKPSDSRAELSVERQAREKELFDGSDAEPPPLPEGWEAARTAEGEEYARRLAKVQTRLAVWSGSRIWWAVRNPLVVQLDARLEAACTSAVENENENGEMMNKEAIFVVLSAIQAREPRTELDFTTFSYVLQKAGLLLMMKLLVSPADGFSDAELLFLEEVLVESKLDPRVVLSLVPGVRNEIVQGRQGIWAYGGVMKRALETATNMDATEGIKALQAKTLHFLRRYLQAWRRMKGFGSVSVVEGEVFQTVDAALLLVLLELDRGSPKGPGRGGAVRAELNELVDGGMAEGGGGFERAVTQLQAYGRLFVLSRLYQSRKMSREVLATWRRVVEGEVDAAEELMDGEQRVRDYLAKLGNRALVQEYGVWLARRNPRLGVQVFAEEHKGRPRFEPAEAVELLRGEAPGAVKYYLEHLVFGSNRAKGGEYVDELIAYYMDVVVGDLAAPASRDRVAREYETYRRLQAPKLTYRHFLAETSSAKDDEDEVRPSRLRLLQLLSSTEYDVAAVREKLHAGSVEVLLVPESIIVSGREGKHAEALRLLVHSLGDYDTATAYCLNAGSSIYSGTPRAPPTASASGVEERRSLFRLLLTHLLALEDVSDRVEQTGALLGRFGAWFDVDDVLRLVPDDWSVDVIAGFLIGALRRLVAEKHESEMARALRGAEHLRIGYHVMDRTRGKVVDT